jgi:hypothetical protein
VAQQLRQLGEVRRHAAGVVAGQPVGCRAALRLIVKVKITERLAAGATDKFWGISDIVKVLEDWEEADE